ncbi:hypothetical protein BKA65DRAFT_550945 [Rhexocercosporidium sp. MPI-PUGE-AT-0058]|nr:hypothetical protein BKA65DRAFT_550945 [Rhexocercosporidium sp. MPI-PUGE-AT-0058]
MTEHKWGGAGKMLCDSMIAEKDNVETVVKSQGTSEGSENDMRTETHDFKNASEAPDKTNKMNLIFHAVDGKVRPICTLRKLRVTPAIPSTPVSQYFKFENEPGFSRTDFTFEVDLKKAETQQNTRFTSTPTTVQSPRWVTTPSSVARGLASSRILVGNEIAGFAAYNQKLFNERVTAIEERKQKEPNITAAHAASAFVTNAGETDNPSSAQSSNHHSCRPVLVDSASVTDGEESSFQALAIIESPSMKTMMEIHVDESQGLGLTNDLDKSYLPPEILPGQWKTLTQGKPRISENQSTRILDLESRILDLESDKTAFEEKLKEIKKQLASIIIIPPKPSNSTPMIYEDNKADVELKNNEQAFGGRKKALFDSQGFAEDNLLEDGDAELMCEILADLAAEIDENLKSNARQETTEPPTRSGWRLANNLTTQNTASSPKSQSKCFIHGNGVTQQLNQGIINNSPPNSKDVAS